MDSVSVAIALWLLASPPAANPSEPEPPVVSSKDLTLKVWTNGKGGYFLANFKEGGGIPDPIFYGNEKFANQQPSPGGGANGDDFSRNIIDPHFQNMRGDVSVESKEGKTVIHCKDTVIPLTPLGEAETKSFLAKVTLREQLWRRSAHLLARDDEGVYYFIDSFRQTQDEFGKPPRDPRLFVGPRGKMKQVEIINAVFDTQGEIYKTKTGTFRLVINAEKRDYRWVNGKKELVLVNVPVEDNLPIIWNDLGVYSNKRYGSPCEDL
jgi:hypothetical protein